MIAPISGRLRRMLASPTRRTRSSTDASAVAMPINLLRGWERTGAARRPRCLASADALCAQLDDLGRRVTGHEAGTGADHVAATEEEAVLHELGHDAHAHVALQV